MTLRQLLDRLSRKWTHSMNPAPRNPRRNHGLRLENLESRETPTADIAAIGDFTSPSNRDLLVPLDLNGASASTVTYSAESSNSAVSVSILPTGRTWVLNVSGVDSTNTAFSGTLTFKLFEDVAPIATQRIISLTQSGFYNGLTFHRVLQNFVAQGGDPLGNGTGGSTQPDFRDEFNPGYTFNSPGLLAMANSGDDTNNSQFFITDTDLTLAQQPQHLNFNHTIFGQLVEGQELFTKLISTPVNSAGRPTTNVLINSATIVEDNTKAVLRVRPNAGFTGNTTITVTANDGSGVSNPETFSVNVVSQSQNSRAYLQPVSNQTAPVGTGVTFQLRGVDVDGDTLTYAVRDAANPNNQPQNVTVTIDQATGLVTVVPNAGFSGTVNLLVGVWDSQSRELSPTGLAEYDTDEMTLTFSGVLDLDADSDTGTLNNDNVTDDATPTFTIRTTPGSTVRISVAGRPNSVVTATESSPGLFVASLAAGNLRVGANSIVAESIPPQGLAFGQIGELSITYAPAINRIYTVPGELGVSSSLTFDFNYRESGFRNEVGIVLVDDDTGAINGVAPNDPNYIRTMLQSSNRQVIFTPEQDPGAARTISLLGGQRFIMYVVSNDTGANVLASALTGGDVSNKVFFTLLGANRDSFDHVVATEDRLLSQVVYAFEDLPDGGDQDFNDNVIIVRSTSTPLTQALQVAANATRAVQTSFTLQPAVTGANPNGTAAATAGGEIGFFPVDDVNGRIGSLNPGDAGYAQAALNRARLIFAATATPDTTTATLLTGGTFLGFYYIPGATAAQVLADNPTNSTGVSNRLAFFSFQAANPDNLVHFRNFSPEMVSLDDNDPTTTRFHVMGQLNGTAQDFDDAVFTVKFGS
ncbi:peptidylprolyl isomerase [Tuwongella immobilis]|uniref:peptidylprolyl isomerase n=1 Tax=Tuwongella immobilis TaxID=692036 RepID=A0A6C2YJW7_9BACT|nr:peptidylprolyl isomerase [Tuwongella immobilis]VIP01868.1 cyclophilin type peptidylprolyl isomerase : Peptidyl-prolyl cis-trans isomerase cyclophilin type OS=Pirellula staleyi (strain ATCC 27377 / DSM 6068 / ICPB 4128) GN=Psta_1955 PE=4 SV=1: Pro_isomerase: DUF4114 [Tuwongella immobilis]VTR99692.1 cyclophilin type peptidylprolyl isomerase : Peptidyl-prolyl cis-trans isomerase cyclophilin type OS=Pirellula staleyi (strain ATCC 27377 / DSM 6068 / ICPB 4128) GN=Psta_1955 PE=4 SV=1: Pro_isomerase: